MTDKQEYAACMRAVAERLLPVNGRAKNKHASVKDDLRFGTNGSLSVKPSEGTWRDHENDKGGGVLDLMTTFCGFSSNGDAHQWLVDEGYIKASPRRANGAAEGTSPQGKFAGFMDDWPIATYQYRDAAGDLAYEVLKFAKTAPRRFMQRRPHPSGAGWIWGLQEGEYGRVKSGDWFKAKEGKSYSAKEHFPETKWWLYRRDEVAAAIKAGKPVLLCEGEKDVETVRAWGWTGTTNQGGAKNWKDHLDEDFRGADVVVLNDNDDAGRQRVLIRGAALRRVAKRVRVLDIAAAWPEAPEKADVTDWRDDAGGTAEKFAALIARSPDWRPEAPRSRFSAVRFCDLDAESDLELDWLVDRWLTAGEKSVLGGPSKSGKSFLAIHAAMCVARGQDFFDNAVKRGGVIYQAGEGKRGVKRRLRAYRKHFDVPDDEDVPLILLPATVDLYSQDGDTAALIDEIKSWSLTMAYPLQLVVIDTLATATAGADENSGKDMGVVLANTARIAEETGAHVMLVHHMNAEGKKLRGHTSIFGNVDQVITVVNDETTRVRTATLSKQKDDEDGLQIRFSLSAVKLGFDERTQRDITSCVVLTVGEKERLKREEEKQGFSVNPTERRIMMNLFEAIDRHGRFIADESSGPRAAIGKTVVQWDHYRDVALERMPEIDDRKKAAEQIRKEFARTKDTLIKFGVIGVASPLMWWNGKPVRGFPRTFPKPLDGGQMADFAGTTAGQMAAADEFDEFFDNGEFKF